MKKIKVITSIFTTIAIIGLMNSVPINAKTKYNEIKDAKKISYGLNDRIGKYEIGDVECLFYVSDTGRASYIGDTDLLTDVDDSKLDTLYYIDKNGQQIVIENVNYIDYLKNGREYGTGNGPGNNSRTFNDGISNFTLAVLKGELKDADPNETRYRTKGNYLFNRYTKEDGTPYKGLYLLKNSDGTPKQWIILDNDGFYLKERSKDNYLSTYINGNLCIDELYKNGPNFGSFDPNSSYKYLGKKDTYQGGDIFYLVLNDWLYEDGKWYHSDEKGLLTKGWYEENGKWYYFTDWGGSFMETNRWIPNKNNEAWYYLGKDGVMATNTTINGHWVNEEGLCIEVPYWPK
ncbi:hypothetical protein FC774_09370 [Clostridium botulinum]|uniref:Cell wall-binding protein n=1 Tax=Clostridium botulinum TaxID=1491 RepID=A0A6M0V5Z6_CLOBO|nr:hypothetical protein [Clostridium botulinum]